uniref:Uncharacterized protein n=1 Tax=Lepeophtheirus salmonis TaxID=72036 RepID=A0A0K2UDC5_LEPSM
MVICTIWYSATTDYLSITNNFSLKSQINMTSLIYQSLICKSRFCLCKL